MTGPHPDRGPRTHLITHRTDYRYSDTVSASYGRAFLRPRELPWQRVLDHRLTVTPLPSDAADGVDVFGNTVHYLHVTAAHRELSVLSTSRVQVDPPPPADRAGTWEQARDAVAGDPDAVDLSCPSDLAGTSAEVLAYARPSLVPGRPLVDVAVELGARIHRDFTYLSGSTRIGTSPAALLAGRSGVCQDFAHLAVACLRGAGLAARYVSGYLATDPPPGRERMVGADATHAWVAVRTASGGWLAFDPTNDQLVDERYTTLAWGRDYSDVPPLRGVIFTDAQTSTMAVSVDVAPGPPPVPHRPKAAPHA